MSSSSTSRAKMGDAVAKTALWGFAGLTLIILLVVIGYIVSKGLEGINAEFLLESPRRMGKEGGIYPTIVSTVYLTAVALVVAVPVGVGSAIYLAEYASDNRATQLIRFGTETLAGIPSIIYGLFGFAFLVIYLGMGWSILSGGLTLSLMVLPTLVRTSEEAIRAVPNSYREGSLALGATKWVTIRRVVLPSAASGIVTGIILSVGRAVGETAAVLLTAGSSLRTPESLADPGRSMAVHLYVLTTEGISEQNAYATATILILAILVINSVANWARGRLRSSTTG